ncbi:MAG TPA: hypothetical protein PKD85_03985 [Saprospiraceae bacterium]|nr:hypothetical protein [Saprospiraceae bacterium]
MNKIILTIILSFLLYQTNAQNTTSKRSLDSLVKEMQIITEEEKAQLMARLVMIDDKVKKGELNVNDALDIKLLETDVTNLRIKRRMAFYEQQLKDNINAQLSGSEIDIVLPVQDYVASADIPTETPKVEKVYGERYNNNSSKTNTTIISKEIKVYKESRYKDYVVLGFGQNSLIEDGNISNFPSTDMSIIQSRNYEFGLSWKYRVLENSSLIMLRYGVSYYRTHLTPRNNLIFQKDNNITSLVQASDEVVNHKFTNNYVMVPVHLELDFSSKYTSKKTGNIHYRSQRGLRLGVGGYLGLLTTSRQETTIIVNNRANKSKAKGDFNVSPILFGTEAYVGVKDVSLRFRYDLSQLFSQNPNQQNVASIGLRWDLW